ncbi:FAD-binding oxidoreductase [Rhodococcus sp. NPDC004095]
MDLQTPVSDETIASLRASLTGSVALPGEPLYELATPWNLAVPVTPRAVVVAADTGDVAATVRFAAEHGLRVAVQRTGHGAVAVSGDVLLVHTGQLNECVVDAGTRTARVGAGAIWQDVLDAAAPHGLAPLTGSSATVGVAGFLTGAGIGPLVRTYGLSSDHVRAFDLVTGDGAQLRVTPDDHAELFWGLRGGKATLGIVTAVEIDLLPISQIYGGALYFDGDDAAAVAHAWLDWCRDLPEHSSTSIAFLQLPPLPQIPPPLAGRLTLAVRFASVAAENDAAAELARLRAVATPLIDAVGPMPYAALSAIHADPVDPMPTHEFSTLTHALPHEAVDALLAVAGPGSGSPQTVIELRLLGGALGREPRHRSAFCHRDASFALMVVGVLAPPVAEAVVEHARGVEQAVAAWSTGGTLPNFAASADPERIARCYDEDTRHWLSALANEHDPNGVLRVGQVVRLPV